MKKLYLGGTILTMEPVREQAEIVITDSDKIIYVGPNRPELAHGCDIIDLQGRCMMPAFLDAHSHFLSLAGSLLQISLKNVTSWEELEDRIKRDRRKNGRSAEKWLHAVGYDQTMLPGNRHPTRSYLDTLCPDQPLILQHISGHMGVLNSAALRTLGIESEDGFLQETEFVACLKKVPPPDTEAILAACEEAQNIYASYGITTVQEGMLVREMIPLYQALLASGKLKLDIIAYADMKDASRVDSAFNGSHAHFKIGGYKIFLDGSPQGGTAWMRTPYVGTNSCGVGTMTDAAVRDVVQTAAETHRQLLAHCNGDAACGQFLTALEWVARRHADLPKTRPVLVHAQLIGLDQLPAVKSTGAILSFFISHVLHWGDVHIRNFGLSRACAISPARSALQHDIPITFHTDTPVLLPNLMEAVGCAVYRHTQNGVPLGTDEGISVTEALKAITIGCAYQYFEEQMKGSICVGKQADFVILDRNPLQTSPAQLGNIRVVETIKNGTTIFRADPGKCTDETA